MACVLLSRRKSRFVVSLYIFAFFANSGLDHEVFSLLYPMLKPAHQKPKSILLKITNYNFQSQLSDGGGRFQFIPPGNMLFNLTDNLSTSVSIEQDQEFSEPESDSTTSPRVREVNIILN